MSAPTPPLYTSALFQRIAGGAWRPGGEELTRRGLALCGFAPGARVLDIGCGAGASLALLRSLGLHGMGLDRQRHLRAACPLVLGDARNPPFADGTFDGLLCECVLSLLTEPEETLRRFAAMLRPGGRLLLTDLFTYGAAPVAAAAAGCMGGARSPAAMDGLFRTAGFDILAFEDHSPALKELAAKLLWYGDADLRAMLRGERGCFCSSQGRYGYGLWVAAPRQEAPPFPRRTPAASD